MACSSSSDGSNSETRKRGLDNGDGAGPEAVHEVYVVNPYPLAIESLRQPAKEIGSVEVSFDCVSYPFCIVSRGQTHTEDYVLYGFPE